MSKLVNALRLELDRKRWRGDGFLGTDVLALNGYLLTLAVRIAAPLTARLPAAPRIDGAGTGRKRAAHSQFAYLP